MKDGFYWFKNDIGGWNPVCVMEDFRKEGNQLVFYLGYNKPANLANIDKTKFGPEIILPKELQNDNSTKPS